MATGTMEDYGVPVQTICLSLSSMKLLCFEMFPDAGAVAGAVAADAAAVWC